MSPTETVYAFAPLLLALAILFAFKRKRRQTADYTESVAVKVALPAWVKNVEFLIFVMFLAMITMGTFDIFVLLLGHSYVSGSLKGASAVYLSLGVGSAGIPVAFLCANLVSSVVPVLRKENQRAFRGHQVSFKSANLGLIKFAYFSVPFGAICLCIAAFSPWAH